VIGWFRRAALWWHRPRSEKDMQAHAAAALAALRSGVRAVEREQAERKAGPMLRRAELKAAESNEGLRLAMRDRDFREFYSLLEFRGLASDDELATAANIWNSLDISTRRRLLEKVQLQTPHKYVTGRILNRLQMVA
jgi:hypothetical protein